jgi:hypothetical protein
MRRARWRRRRGSGESPLLLVLLLLLLLAVRQGAMAVVQDAAGGGAEEPEAATKQVLGLTSAPPRITASRRAVFSWSCPSSSRDGDCMVQFSLDGDAWRRGPQDRGVEIQGLGDGMHELRIRSIPEQEDGWIVEEEEEVVKYEWLVDTLPPQTFIDSVPSPLVTEAPRDSQAFMFFTFHCSEPSCTYRYSFDDTVELYGTLSLPPALKYPDTQPSPLSALEGQILLTQVESSDQSQSALHLSAFISGRAPPPVSAESGEGGASSLPPAYIIPVEVRIYDVNDPTKLINATLPEPEVDPESEQRLWSLSGNQLVDWVVNFESELVAEVWGYLMDVVQLPNGEMEDPNWLSSNNLTSWTNQTNSLEEVMNVTSTLELEVVAISELQESTTSKQWLPSPSSASPGEHFFAIAAMDEAGNADPSPATWRWSVSSEPSAYFDSAPPSVSCSATAQFKVSCLLPVIGGSEEGSGTSADPPPGHSDDTACYYAYSLDDGDWTPLGTPDSPVIEIFDLADGPHSFAVHACLSSKSDDVEPICAPQGQLLSSVVTREWVVDTSVPKTKIDAYPSTLSPSVFVVSASKPGCRFSCSVDFGPWAPCPLSEDGGRFELQLDDGLHALMVMAVDPAGRLDPEPQKYEWQVSMLDTVVEYCPIGALPLPLEGEPFMLSFGVGAEYGGLPCGSSNSGKSSSAYASSDMGCTVSYTLTHELRHGATWGSSSSSSLTGDNNSTSVLVAEGSITEGQGIVELDSLTEVGSYTLTMTAMDRFGNADGSPAVCEWDLLEEATFPGGAGHAPTLKFLMQPKDVLLNNDATLVFEIAAVVEDGDASLVTVDQNASLQLDLEWILKGPGLSRDWVPLTPMPSSEWERIIDRVPGLNETTYFVTDYPIIGGRGQASLAWGAELEELGSGIFSLLVRDRRTGVVASTSWESDALVPHAQLTLAPQQPSHSAYALAQISCSRRDCLMAWSLDGEEGDDTDSWPRLSEPLTDESGGGAVYFFDLSLSDLAIGNHVLRLMPISLTGLRGEVISYSWDVDLSKPETRINSAPEPVTADSSASFQFSCTLADESVNGDCSYEYQLLRASVRSDAWYPTRSPVVLYHISDGVHAIRVRARLSDEPDAVDSSPAEYLWVRDAVEPEALLLKHPQPVAHAKSAYFEVVCSDAADEETGSCEFEYSLDGQEWLPTISQLSLTDLSDGMHGISFRVTDTAGNIGNTLDYSWRVDSSLPDTVLISAPHDHSVATSAHFFLEDTVNATVGMGYFEWQLDEGPWEVTLSPAFGIPYISEGVHSIVMRAILGNRNLATDKWGGHSEDLHPLIYQWTVDTTAPDTDIAVYPSVVTHLMSAIFVLRSDGGATSFEYLVDAAEEWVSLAALLDEGSTVRSTAVIVLQHLAQGVHTLRARAVDAAGNQDASPASYAWIVDRAGLYGYPGMPTSVVASGGDTISKVRWDAPSDDGGGSIAKYMVVASTAFTDISVETVTTVLPASYDAAPHVNDTGSSTDAEVQNRQPSAAEIAASQLPPTEATIFGLTNGLVYTFSVTAVNDYGYSNPSLDSNKVLLYDPLDPCGLMICGDHGTCYLGQSSSGALSGKCLCRPGFTGPDCKQALPAGSSKDGPFAWSPQPFQECSKKCGSGVRLRNITCSLFQYGTAVGSASSRDACGKDWGEDMAFCRQLSCISDYLTVSFTIEVSYEDLCFSVVAQDAFLASVAFEVAQDLHISRDRIMDMDAAQDGASRTRVSFVVSEGHSIGEQPPRVIMEQLILQAKNPSSPLRTRGTWTRHIDPQSTDINLVEGKPTPYGVTQLTHDVITILIFLGSTCLVGGFYGLYQNLTKNKPPIRKGAGGDAYYPGSDDSDFDDMSDSCDSEDLTFIASNGNCGSQRTVVDRRRSGKGFSVRWGELPTPSAGGREMLLRRRSAGNQAESLSPTSSTIL